MNATAGPSESIQALPCCSQAVPNIEVKDPVAEKDEASSERSFKLALGVQGVGTFIQKSAKRCGQEKPLWPEDFRDKAFPISRPAKKKEKLSSGEVSST